MSRIIESVNNAAAEAVVKSSTHSKHYCDRQSGPRMHGGSRPAWPVSALRSLVAYDSTTSMSVFVRYPLLLHSISSVAAAWLGEFSTS